MSPASIFSTENQHYVPQKCDRSMAQILENLALECKQHPPKSQARKVALTKLYKAIRQSDKLYCQDRYKFPPEVYEEALQEVWIDVCRKIDNYDPAKGTVMNWINRLLGWRFTDAIKRHTKKGRELYIDAPIEQPEDTPLVSEEVRQCIEEDPEGLFQQKHLKNCLEANFRSIALRRFAGESWEELEKTFGIQLSTLSKFYQRSIKYFVPKFKEYLQK